jgi:hypothetical protein
MPTGTIDFSHSAPPAPVPLDESHGAPSAPAPLDESHGAPDAPAPVPQPNTSGSGAPPDAPTAVPESTGTPDAPTAVPESTGTPSAPTAIPESTGTPDAPGVVPAPGGGGVQQAMVDLFTTSITDLTGGGTNRLDALSTTSMRTGSLVRFVMEYYGLVAYQLQARTETTSAPALIRPLDYNDTTNARVWVSVS